MASSKYFSAAAETGARSLRSARAASSPRASTKRSAPEAAPLPSKRRREQARGVQWHTSKDHTRKEPTPFQSSVYRLTQTVPAGKVVSYGELARELGTSARAVGNALRNNPFAPVVPCHRVVASSRTLGGFAGQKGDDAPNIATKKKMLKDEGVLFEPMARRTTVSPLSMHYFQAATAA